MIILGYHCVAILLAKMLIWAHFSHSMCTFSVLTPACSSHLGNETLHDIALVICSLCDILRLKILNKK